MPKIVHLITGLNTGGAETALYRLLATTDRGRFPSVVVSLTDAGDVGPLIRALGVPLHTLEMRRGRFGARAAARLVGLLRREAPDVLQTWLYHADLVGALAARWAGVRALAWNLRCSCVPLDGGVRGGGLVLGALARLSRVPDAVVTNSRAGRDSHVARGYRPRRWEVIANGFDVGQFRPSADARARLRAELGIGAATPVVGLVARFDPMKDHPTFLRAAALLAGDRPDAVFVLAGREVTAGNAALAREIHALGLGGRVHLLGPRTDLPAIYPAFDVAALSSISEGFPNVVGEAMACGVPCAVTDVGDAALLVGDTGRTVPPRDPAALAGAWRELLALPPEERAGLGARARARIAERFSLAATVHRYEALYLELAAPGAAVSPAGKAA